MKLAGMQGAIKRMPTVQEDIEKLKALEQDYEALIQRLKKDGPAGNYAEIFQLERKVCKVIAKRLELEGRGLV